MYNLLKLIRLEQWIKNLLVFLVPIFANQLEFFIFYDLTIIFFGFSFLVSTGYIINDILDLESDKLHYLKKNRVLASGLISIKSSKIIAFISFALGTFILFNNSLKILLVCYFYLFTSILYSKYLKYFKFLDIIIISIFFVFRAYLGSLGSEINISIYLLLIIFFSSLAVVVGKKLSILLDDNIVESAVKTAIKKNYSTRFLGAALQVFFGLTLVTFNIWIFTNINASENIFIISNILLLFFCIKFYKLTIQSKTEDFITALKNDRLLMLTFIFFIFFTMLGILF